ncbi:MAG: reverse transcriptase family protein [Planctomycetota bacterium]
MSNLFWIVVLGPAGIIALLVLIGLVIASLRSMNLIGYAGEEHFAHRKRALKGEGHDVRELARRLDVPLEKLERLQPNYHAFTITKRRGGLRQLHAPSPELKTMQRRILRRLLGKLRVHPCAVGFEPGLSIAHNASFHVGQAVVIKLDLEDFFPSTTAERVEHYFRRIGWDAQAAALLTRLTTHDGGLPQGAPTSPRLSNLVNHVFDAQVLRYVERHRGTYTRYADDITISYPEDWPKYVRGTIQAVRRIAKRHGYRVHGKGKLRVLRRHQRQSVTGLVVNDKVALPRETRRRLRAAEHRLRKTGRATLTGEQLAGWHALQHMIDRHATPPEA